MGICEIIHGEREETKNSWFNEVLKYIFISSLVDYRNLVCAFTFNQMIKCPGEYIL